MVEKISVDELHARMKAQNVTARKHVAFICPICATVQSITSLENAGSTAEQAEKLIGYSCEGRLSNAGPWPARDDKSQKAKDRRAIRGCDWSLGGLFSLHKLEVLTDNGPQACFELATPEQAQALEASLTPEVAEP